MDHILSAAKEKLHSLSPVKDTDNKPSRAMSPLTVQHVAVSNNPLTRGGMGDNLVTRASGHSSYTQTRRSQGGSHRSRSNERRSARSPQHGAKLSQNGVTSGPRGSSPGNTAMSYRTQSPHLSKPDLPTSLSHKDGGHTSSLQSQPFSVTSQHIDATSQIVGSTSLTSHNGGVDSMGDNTGSENSPLTSEDIKKGWPDDQKRKSRRSRSPSVKVKQIWESLVGEDNPQQPLK